MPPVENYGAFTEPRDGVYDEEGSSGCMVSELFTCHPGHRRLSSSYEFARICLWQRLLQHDLATLRIRMGPSVKSLVSSKMPAASDQIIRHSPFKQDSFPLNFRIINRIEPIPVS